MFIEFYGETCPHCVKMMPIVDKLIAEGIKIEKKETWNNEKNATEFEKYDKGRCGGVPFFINTKTDAFICGGTDEESLRKLAEGK